MVSIELLKDHMTHIPSLAQIWREELGRVWIPTIGADEVRSWMLQWKHENQLPIAHIAFASGRPIGVCALQQNDGIRPDLFPWLTDLCVHGTFHNQGVGSRLIDATIVKAKSLGFKNLYLFTFDQNLVSYYHRFGFAIIGQDQHRGYPVTVMMVDLSQ